eukprot:10149442-Alexandrium_andersonii.AAC.1
MAHSAITPSGITEAAAPESMASCTLVSSDSGAASMRRGQHGQPFSPNTAYRLEQPNAPQNLG